MAWNTLAHIIEDMNAHARMAYSAGHYFRALDGQHMAGIDVVLHQIVPAMAALARTRLRLRAASQIQHFSTMCLAKLAASHAAYPAAYEGPRDVRSVWRVWLGRRRAHDEGLLDHMLVRAHQPFCAARVFSRLSQSGLPATLWRRGAGSAVFWFYQAHAIWQSSEPPLCGAKHEADVAIVYHAELEWCNGASSMLTQVPAKILYETADRFRYPAF